MKRFKWSVENILKNLLRIFLFVLPWQTILITRESFLNGVKWEYGTLGFYATEILLWLIFFVFIAWVLKHKNFNIKISNLKLSKDRIFLFFILLFVLWSFASILWSFDKDLALQQSLHIMEALVLFLMIFIGPLNIRQLGYWFVLGSVPVILLAISQFVFQTTWDFKWLGLSEHTAWLPGASIVASDSIGRLLRSYGSFSHPNIMGGYMAMVFLWSIILFSMRVFGNRYGYLFQYILSTLIITGLFLNFSRAALGVSVFCILILMLYSFYNKKGFFSSFSCAYIVLLFVSFVIVFLPILETRFSVSSQAEIVSVTERSSSIVESWEIFQDNKWIGVGIGNYTLASYQKDPTRPGWEYQPVHNIPLLIVSEIGIIGFSLLMLVILSCLIFLHGSAERMKKRKDWLINNMSFVFMSVLLLFFYITLALFDHYLFSSYIGLLMTGLYSGLSCRYILNNVHR